MFVAYSPYFNVDILISKSLTIKGTFFNLIWDCQLWYKCRRLCLFQSQQLNEFNTNTVFPKKYITATSDYGISMFLLPFFTSCAVIVPLWYLMHFTIRTLNVTFTNLFRLIPNWKGAVLYTNGHMHIYIALQLNLMTTFPASYIINVILKNFKINEKNSSNRTIVIK